MTYQGAPELRQRQEASRSIVAYRAGKLSLRELIDELDDFWVALEASPWVDEFRGHWWTLEQIYAVALDRGELSSLSDEAKSDIDEAVACIVSLLEVD